MISGPRLGGWRVRMGEMEHPNSLGAAPIGVLEVVEGPQKQCVSCGSAIFISSRRPSRLFPAFFLVQTCPISQG